MVVNEREWEILGNLFGDFARAALKNSRLAPDFPFFMICQLFSVYIVRVRCPIVSVECFFAIFGGHEIQEMATNGQ